MLLVVPALALVGLLAAGIGFLAWASLHSYDTFLGLQGKFSFSEYSAIVHDRQFQTDLVRTLTMAVHHGGRRSVARDPVQPGDGAEQAPLDATRPHGRDLRPLPDG